MTVCTVEGVVNCGSRLNNWCKKVLPVRQCPIINTGGFAMTVSLINLENLILSMRIKTEEIKEFWKTNNNRIRYFGCKEKPFLTSNSKNTGNLIPVRRLIMFIKRILFQDLLLCSPVLIFRSLIWNS
jgi:hypothetical protein